MDSLQGEGSSRSGSFSRSQAAACQDDPDRNAIAAHRIQSRCQPKLLMDSFPHAPHSPAGVETQPTFGHHGTTFLMKYQSMDAVTRCGKKLLCVLDAVRKAGSPISPPCVQSQNSACLLIAMCKTVSTIDPPPGGPGGGGGGRGGGAGALAC